MAQYTSTMGGGEKQQQQQQQQDEHESDEETRDYWEYVEEQMALLRVHFPLSSAQDRYNIADKSWDEMMKIVVKRESEMDQDEEIEE